ncbi:hypothetical protein [Rhodococcus sp. OK519]|uniref:hypothetical protein n=1 Tax=Rhodococcus sp. OK519 TaxID=2135729 RepID=UPI0011B1D777
MAETPTEIKVPVTLPVYTRVNGQEIELGTYSLTVPIKVEITGSGEALSDEGPWLRWQDVPEGVLYTDRRRNGRWCNGRGERFVRV